jgi:hypothetical protein
MREKLAPMGEALMALLGGEKCEFTCANALGACVPPHRCRSSCSGGLDSGENRTKATKPPGHRCILVAYYAKRVPTKPWLGDAAMADGPARKTVKVGVKEGGGPPPGYQWNVDVLDRAHDEAMAFLNQDQYDHLANQVRELARHDDPSHSSIIDIRPIEDFYELRDKGGILGRLNVRVFYYLRGSNRRIVILGAIKKENNGPTPVGDRLCMRRRKRLHEADHPAT